jgi:hypothetical protein
VGGKCGEFVRVRAEGQSGKFGDLSGSALSKLREVFIQLTGDNFVSRCDNQIGFLLRQLSQVLIYQSGSLLQDPNSPNQFGWRSILSILK